MCHGIFRRSNRGGAPDAVGFANAPTGCNTIDSWKMKFGDCDPRDAILASTPTSSSAPASTSASATAKRGDGYKKSFSNSDGQQIQFEWLMGTGFTSILYTLLVRSTFWSLLECWGSRS